MDKAEKVFNKLAAIYGATYADNKYMPRNPHIPFDTRVEKYKNYVKTKSKESTTPWGQAVGIPAGVGSVLGGLTGAAAGRTSMSGRWAAPAIIGAALGSVLGAGIGVVNKKLDDQEMEYVKALLASKNTDKAVKDSLVERLEDIYTREALYEEFRDDRRHRELIAAIKNKNNAT